MEKYRGKIFNEQVFEKYMKTLPSTKENSLIKNGLFTVVNKYKSKMVDETGGYAIEEPIKGRIGGTPTNYDGSTDISKGTERITYHQRKIAYGRAKAWGEYDFASEVTGTNFMAEAQEVKDYWDEQRQSTVLAILKGIFGMTGGADGNFVTKHTYDISEQDGTAANLGADAMNRAAQKALGDKKQNLDIVFMHSVVSTNLEGLNLINFLKYTDSDGIERDLTIGTFNGRLVIVDDEVQELSGYDEATSATAGALKVVSGTASAGQISLTDVQASDYYPAGVAANDYVIASNKYVSYAFKRGFFEYEDLGVKTPSELVRNAYEKGGFTDLVTRVREIIVPTLISYKGTGSVSPANSALATGSNWELVNDNDSVSKTYVDDKLIPIVRIISRG